MRNQDKRNEEGNHTACRIVIAGVHKSDLVMYCAFALQSLSFRVLVCDHTRHQELESCIVKPKKHMELVRYQKMDFAFSEFAALDENYDYMVFVQDFEQILPENIQACVYVCDGERIHIEECMNILLSENVACAALDKGCLVIFRDLFAAYEKEYLDSRKEKLGQAIQVLEVPHDCLDEAVYQKTQYQPLVHLPELSEQMDAALKKMLCFFTQMDEKTIKKAVKYAKRGSTF